MNGTHKRRVRRYKQARAPLTKSDVGPIQPRGR